MSSYEMLVLDIDGTLLDSSGRLRPAVRKAVRAAVDSGLLVTLATGRRFGSVKPIMEDLGLKLPVILQSGALIVDFSSESVMNYTGLSNTALVRSVRAITQFGLQPIVFEHNGVNTVAMTGPSEYDNELCGGYIRVSAKTVHRVNYEELEKYRNPLSVAALDDKRRVGLVLTNLGDMPDARVIVIDNFRFGASLLEVMSSNCSKGMAVRTLAKHYGTDLAKVVAIGDATNDIEMIDEVGLGIAMGNASDEVKFRAKLIVPSHDENGVAIAIEKYIL